METIKELEITKLRNEVKELRDFLEKIRRELGAILDILIELLPHQKADEIHRIGVLMASVRDLIKEIEKYVR